jgi:hypothetical protein
VLTASPPPHSTSLGHQDGVCGCVSQCQRAWSVASPLPRVSARPPALVSRSPSRAGLKKETERADLIAYLKQASELLHIHHTLAHELTPRPPLPSCVRVARCILMAPLSLCPLPNPCSPSSVPASRRVPLSSLALCCGGRRQQVEWLLPLNPPPRLNGHLFDLGWSFYCSERLWFAGRLHDVHGVTSSRVVPLTPCCAS